MTTKFRLHGNDKIGSFTIEGKIEELEECVRNLRNDPEVDDLWVEYYDDEEGCQA